MPTTILNIPVEYDATSGYTLNELKDKLTAFATSLMKKRSKVYRHSALEGILKDSDKTAEELIAEHLEEKYGI